MRDIQLVCYYTGKPAREEDRVRIQTTIDCLQKEIKEAKTETERGGLEWPIMALQGKIRMPRG